MQGNGVGGPQETISNGHTIPTAGPQTDIPTADKESTTHIQEIPSESGGGFLDYPHGLCEGGRQAVELPLQEELAALTMESDDDQSPLKSTALLVAHTMIGAIN